VTKIDQKKGKRREREERGYHRFGVKANKKKKKMTKTKRFWSEVKKKGKHKESCRKWEKQGVEKIYTWWMTSQRSQKNVSGKNKKTNVGVTDKQRDKRERERGGWPLLGKKSGIFKTWFGRKGKPRVGLEGGGESPKPSKGASFRGGKPRVIKGGVGQKRKGLCMCFPQTSHSIAKKARGGKTKGKKDEIAGHG